MNSFLISSIFFLFYGSSVHLGVFIRGEWHLRTAHAVAIPLLLFCLGFLFWTAWLSAPVPRYNTMAALLFLPYIMGLYGSLSIYRLVFHRLRKFPGPRLAALSKLWHVYQCRDSRNHLVLDGLYKKYGTFVRSGKPSLQICFHQTLEEAPLNSRALADASYGRRTRGNNRLSSTHIRNHGWSW